MNTYSEYHASQIELLSQMNVKTIKSVSRKIPNKYMIQGKDSCITINDYILYPLANAFDILNSNKVSAKYSCGFPDPQVLPIIVVDRYLDYFTTIMEDRLWQVLAEPVSRWRNRSGLSMNAARAA